MGKHKYPSQVRVHRHQNRSNSDRRGLFSQFDLNKKEQIRASANPHHRSGLHRS